MSAPKLLPVLMREGEIISAKAAVHYAGRSDSTIRRWVDEFGIGRQATRHSPLEISKVALEMVLNGDHAALELLRAGDRSSPSVRRYLDFLGLQP